VDGPPLKMFLSVFQMTELKSNIAAIVKEPSRNALGRSLSKKFACDTIIIRSLP
jgi:hypothetical protein